MSAKPSQVPTFNTSGANRSAPSSGLRTSGWGLGSTPTSSVFNNEQNLYGQWFQYLNDGAFSGASSFDNALTVAGALATTSLPLTFASVSYTVADQPTGKLTITGHGLNTGDGPFQLTTTGSLPTGLTTLTNYWAIVIDANTIQLATSLANAFAGIFIVLSSNGSGTNTIVGVSSVRPSDLTVGRNGIIGGNLTVGGSVSAPGGVTIGGNASITGTLTAGALHVSRTRRFSIANAVFFSPAQFTFGSGCIQGIDLSTSNAASGLPLEFAVSDTITAWAVNLTKTSATGTITAKLYKVSTTGAVTVIGVAQSNSANNPGVITLGQSGLTEVVASGFSYGIAFAGGGVSGDSIQGYSATAG